MPKIKNISTITPDQIERYTQYLREQERSSATVQKYIHDLTSLYQWLDGRELTKAVLIQWKEHLVETCSPATVNAKLSAANGLLCFLGREDCRMKFLKLQRRVFRDTSRELVRGDYLLLVDTARCLGREWLAMTMETLCATGIRVSELKYITVEAATAGRADVSLKGKIRSIILPGKLARKLLKYAKQQKTASGAIFRTKDGKPLTRFQIWRAMKSLCRKAGVESSKVFPHNLRHLFAATFYRATRDIVKLADVLGHSSINTTRIYLLSTGAEHARQLEQLGLVC